MGMKESIIKAMSDLAIFIKAYGKVAVYFILILILVVAFAKLYNAYLDSIPRVVMLHVGQGDSTYITDGKYRVLVDTGRGTEVFRSIKNCSAISNKVIDVLVLSHGDLDHVESAVWLLDRYEVKNIIIGNSDKDSVAMREILDKSKLLGINIQRVEQGDSFSVGDMEFNVLWPVGPSSSKDENRNSIVLSVSLDAGDRKLTSLLLADNPLIYDNFLGALPDVDVLKVSHHGSKTGTSKYLIDKVKPEVAFVSYGAGNTYGHPHSEVTDRLKDATVNILETGDGFSKSVFIEQGKLISKKC